jgi:hypothetical protein
MDIDFSSFLPKEGESTKEYYARALGAGVSADAPASERAEALPDMPAVKAGGSGELRGECIPVHVDWQRLQTP